MLSQQKERCPVNSQQQEKALLYVACLAAAVFMANDNLAADDLPSKFSNQTSIANTRHNLTQRQASGGPVGAMMDPYRSDYGEVCVFCHTPHGAAANGPAPLWNRAVQNTEYATYDQLRTSMTQTVSQPGAASLSCLSCHNGQQAIDAVLNMPGAGRYSSAPNNAFLDTWRNARGPGPFVHANQTECLTCHSQGAGIVVGAGATDFTLAVIGTDLRNDHPVGVTFPATSGEGTEWKKPNGSLEAGNRTVKYYDENSNGRIEKDEIRFYDSGNGPAVECASCHDPHGVASSRIATFNATFLRKPAQDVCLTCHNK